MSTREAAEFDYRKRALERGEITIQLSADLRPSPAHAWAVLFHDSVNVTVLDALLAIGKRGGLDLQKLAGELVAALNDGETIS